MPYIAFFTYTRFYAFKPTNNILGINLHFILVRNVQIIMQKNLYKPSIMFKIKMFTARMALTSINQR